MIATDVTNRQLLDEISKRLGIDCDSRYREQLSSLEQELVKLAIRLKEAEKCKSHFLSNIRNEVNNPLTSIMGLALSIGDISTEEQIRRMGMLIHRQAAALEFQMRNIILAAEIETGDIKISPSIVDVMGLLENATWRLKGKIEEHNVLVQLEITETLRFVTDGHALEMICINLLANAIEFSEPNKPVIVDVEKVFNELRLSVADFGTGIEPEIRNNLFQRFKQGESGLRKKHPGHGLGLSIVNELVLQLGGTLTMESTVKTGTTVVVRIPEMFISEDSSPASGSGNELLFSTGEQL